MKTNSNNKTTRGNASQFFVAGELCRRGLIAVVTMGNTPNTDILCSNELGTKFVHIQVKTFVPGNKTVSVGKKAERDYGKRFIWVLSGIPQPESDKPFEFYIVPSSIVSKNERISTMAKNKVNNTEITIVSLNEADYISLTDIAKHKTDDASAVIANWMRNRNTIEFLGIWEHLYNPHFKPLEF
jgi:hypothetical protein